MLTFYGYDKCSTCRNARKHLDAAGVEYRFIDITAAPPPKTLLRAILNAGDYALKDLFNKSGQLYREMKIKDRLPAMSESQAVDLLAKHGKLCRRPIVTNGKRHTVGYDAPAFSKTWG